MRMFCDMDGVLVNWSKGAAQRISSDKEIMSRLDKIKFKVDWDNFSGYDVEEGLAKYNMEVRGMNAKKAKRTAKGRFWKPFQGDSDWWANLEWMPDGKKLWGYLLSLKETGKINELNILTSPASDPACPVGKNQWLERHGLASQVDNIYIDTNKSQYATGPDDVLIDDTLKKIKGWRDAGGTGVLHKATVSTLNDLKELGL